MMDIYIKPKKKARIIGKQTVTVRDVAEIYAPEDIAYTINNIPVFQIPSKENNSYLLSVLDIVSAISRVYPDSSVINAGEADTILVYSKEEKKENKIWEWAKVGFVAIVLLVGSSTAIMSFHNDGDIPLIFNSFYYIFFQEKVDNPMIMDIPYSVGIAVGILVFFNHYSKKREIKDPTPIEVEMAMYQEQADDSAIISLQNEKGKKG